MGVGGVSGLLASLHDEFGVDLEIRVLFDQAGVDAAEPFEDWGLVVVGDEFAGGV